MTARCSWHHALLLVIALSATGCGTAAPAAEVSTTTVTATAPTVKVTRTATETVRVTESITVAPAAPTEDPTAGASAWPEPYALGLAPSPPFVDHISGWRLVQQWESTTRAFGGQWSAATGSEADGYRFPATQNGCDNQMFLIRWRAVGATAGQDITASWTYPSDVGATPDQVTQVEGDKSVTGEAGWIALGGCEVPVWTLAPAGAESHNLRDIAVAVQQWYPSAAG